MHESHCAFLDRSVARHHRHEAWRGGCIQEGEAASSPRVPWDGEGGSLLDRFVALRSAMVIVGGVIEGAEAIADLGFDRRRQRKWPNADNT